MTYQSTTHIEFILSSAVRIVCPPHQFLLLIHLSKIDINTHDRQGTHSASYKIIERSYLLSQLRLYRVRPEKALVLLFQFLPDDMSKLGIHLCLRLQCINDLILREKSFVEH